MKTLTTMIQSAATALFIVAASFFLPTGMSQAMRVFALACVGFVIVAIIQWVFRGCSRQGINRLKINKCRRELVTKKRLRIAK